MFEKLCDLCKFYETEATEEPCKTCSDGLISMWIITDNKPALHEAICENLNTIYMQKNNDYGDSFAEMRKEYPNAILIRIHDKYARLKRLMSGIEQQVNDESIEDTLMDLANYCIMELVERERDKHSTEPIVGETDE